MEDHVNAAIRVALTANSAEDAQKMLIGMLEQERHKGTISDYSFEIASPAGIVTQRCIMSDGNVVA